MGALPWISRLWWKLIWNDGAWLSAGMGAAVGPSADRAGAAAPRVKQDDDGDRQPRSAAQQSEAVDVLQQAIATESQLGVTRAPIWMAQSGPNRPELVELSVKVAPAVGFEPTTKRLTAARSTTELRRNA